MICGPWHARLVISFANCHGKSMFALFAIYFSLMTALSQSSELRYTANTQLEHRELA